MKFVAQNESLQLSGGFWEFGK